MTAAFWTCARCDVVNDLAVRTCENCGALRSARQDAPPSPSANTCARCGGSSPSTNTFHDDGDPQDRGLRLCPACWIPALRRRALRDPIAPQDLAAGMAQIRVLAARFHVEPRAVVTIALAPGE